jgi:hypothetical protein
MGFILPALVAAAPSIIDLFSGATRKRKQALDSQDQVLTEQQHQLQTQIGPSATENTMYKGAEGLLNRSYKRNARQTQGTLLAAGATPESMTGAIAANNEAYNSGQLGALQNTERMRMYLRDQLRNLAIQKAGMGVARADDTVNRQNAYVGGLASLLPYLNADSQQPQDAGRSSEAMRSLSEYMAGRF